MTAPPSKTGVIIPVHNEPRLAYLLNRFDFASAPQVVVVDDGSTDGCLKAAGGRPVIVLRQEPRAGIGAAIRLGLAHLKAAGFDVAVVMAGNNKDDPADIPVLLEAIAGGADYVQGSRFLEAERALGTPLRRRLITRLVARLWSVRFLRRLSDVTNGFRAYRLTLLDDSRIDISQDWLKRYELEYDIHYKVLSLGYPYAEVAVSKDYPTDGLPTSKIKLARDFWSLMRPFVLLTLGLRK